MSKLLLFHDLMYTSGIFKGAFMFTVRAETIPELILERAGPAIFKTFLLELIAVGLIPVICPARRAKTENNWKQ